MEDDKIVDMYLKRDEAAIKCTAQKYGSRLYAVSYRITADARTAEECENDTYLKAWNSIPPQEPRTYLPAFLLKIVRNISIDRCRKENALKREVYISQLSEEMEQCIPSLEDTESRVEGKILGEIISRYLWSLPENKRLIFMHRYFYMDSVEEIAKRFGYGKSRVKTTLFRLRADLRKYLIKEGYTL